MREWISKGTMPAGQTDDDEPTSQPPGQRTKVGEGMSISAEQVENFKEMGGIMARQPSRRELEMMGAFATKPAQGEPDEVVSST